jgi:hypothetical protein
MTQKSSTSLPLTPQWPKRGHLVVSILFSYMEVCLCRHDTHAHMRGVGRMDTEGPLILSTSQHARQSHLYRTPPCHTYIPGWMARCLQKHWDFEWIVLSSSNFSVLIIFSNSEHIFQYSFSSPKNEWHKLNAGSRTFWWKAYDQVLEIGSPGNSLWALRCVCRWPTGSCTCGEGSRTAGQKGWPAAATQASADFIRGSGGRIGLRWPSLVAKLRVS